jgi:hypothetical protein
MTNGAPMGDDALDSQPTDRGEAMRAVTEALAAGPERAFALFTGGEPRWRSLPADDRPAYIDAWSHWVAHVSESPPDEQGQASAQATREFLVPWLWTVDQWAQNPSVDRLLTVLGGDGPAIGPPSPPSAGSGDIAQSGPHRVRAADDEAGDAWDAAASTLPALMANVWDSLRSDPAPLVPVERLPLRGRLGHVTIGDRVLAHWEARHSGTIRRGRRTKKDKVRIVGAPMGSGWAAARHETRVLYAVDEANTTVWVTDVHIFTLDPRTAQWAHVQRRPR